MELHGTATPVVSCDLATRTTAKCDAWMDPVIFCGEPPDVRSATVGKPAVCWLRNWGRTATSPGCVTQASDDSSHGTHVAGIIAAAGNNSIGIAGVAFGVKVLPLKALDCTGAGQSSDVAAAIVYAVVGGLLAISYVATARRLFALAKTRSTETINTSSRPTRNGAD